MQHGNTKSYNLKSCDKCVHYTGCLAYKNLCLVDSYINYKYNPNYQEQVELTPYMLKKQAREPKKYMEELDIETDTYKTKLLIETYKGGYRI